MCRQQIIVEFGNNLYNQGSIGSIAIRLHKPHQISSCFQWHAHVMPGQMMYMKLGHGMAHHIGSLSEQQLDNSAVACSCC